MSFCIKDPYSVPDKSAEVARATFPKANLSLMLFDIFLAQLLETM
jgi:hypothetical protein